MKVGGQALCDLVSIMRIIVFHLFFLRQVFEYLVVGVMLNPMNCLAYPLEQFCFLGFRNKVARIEY